MAAFALYVVGEGIDKKVTDFAAEVKAQMEQSKDKPDPAKPTEPAT